MVLQALCCSMFGTVSVLTGHEHWQKEPSEVEPIVGPLCRMVEAMPKAALKALEARINPIMLIGGACVVIGPDVAAEVKLRRLEAELRNAHREETTEPKQRGAWPPRFIQSPGPAASRSHGAPPASPEPPARGAVDWTASLPGRDLLTDYE